MKANKAIAVAMAIFLVFLAGCTGSPNQSQASSSSKSDQVIQWDYLNIISQDNPASKSILNFVEEVKEKTNGRLIINIREPGELPFKNDEFIRVVGENSVQMAWGLMPAISGDLETGAILGLPFMISNSDDLKTAMSILKPDLEAELSKYGTGLLFYYTMPNQNLWGQGQAINSIDDIKGMKMRASGAEQSDFLSMKDAFPVSINAAEVPTSLSRGVVNGVVTAGLNLLGSKWYDSLDWGYIINLQSDTILTLVNQKALDELPEDIRAILLETAEKHVDLACQLLSDLEKDARKSLVEEHNMTIIEAPQEEVDALIDEFSDYWVDWADKRGGKVPESLQKVRQALGK